MNVPEDGATAGEAEFDSFAGNYDEELQRALDLTGETKDYFAEGRVRWLKLCLDKLNTGKLESCLDFGCGTGGSAPYLTGELGVKSYLGYDPSRESVKVGESAPLQAGIEFTTELDRVRNGGFDMAFCNGVFHHIPPEQRAAAVAAIHEGLRPGGIFAFWENNPWNPIVHYLMSKVAFDRDAKMLFPHGARKMLRAAGFQVLGHTYKFIFPSSLARLRRIEGWLRCVPAGGQYQVLCRKPLPEVGRAPSS